MDELKKDLIPSFNEKFMKQALYLAKKGYGKVSPNPLVGAVIVKDGKVIGEGCHEHYGGLHAERNAFLDCKKRGNDASGATLYVTLEPCCHYGKTPPCTEAIIENKISCVVYGAFDPNPKVAGKGLEILKKAGIKVIGPILEEECYHINEVFFHYIKTKNPFVILKYAMTADGKVATYKGDSRWITSHDARQDVHLTRKKVSGILVGISTVIYDNPMLNCRLDGEDSKVDYNPIRIVCDSKLRIPMDSRLVKTAGEIRTIVAHVPLKNNEKEKKKKILEEKGIEFLEIDKDNFGHIDITKLLRKLGSLGIDSVLIEGGAEIAWSALEAGVVNKLQVYIGSKVVGGRDSKAPVGGRGFEKMEESIILEKPKVTFIGNDLLLEYYITNKNCK